MKERDLLSYTSRIFCCDFETFTPNSDYFNLTGKTDSYLQGWINFDTKEFQYFIDKKAWWNSLVKIAKSRNQTLILYFHNAKFDCSFLYQFLTENYKYNDCKWIKEGEFKGLWGENKQVYCLKIKLSKNAGITIYDTLNKLNGTIAQFGEMVGVPKLDINYDEQNWHFKSKADVPLHQIRYLKRDIEIMCKIISYQNTDFHKKMTIGSRTYFACQNNVGFKRFDKLFHWIDDPILWDKGKQSYFGGLTNCQWGQTGKIINNVYHYDINSSYPDVMDKPLPTTIANCQQIDCQCRKLYKLQLFNLKLNENMPAGVLTSSFHRTNIKTYQDRFFINEQFVNIWLWEHELQLVKKAYTIKSIKIQEVLHFNQSDVIKNYVQYLYKLKKQYKKDNNEVMYYTVKILLNALYGKFGQDWRRDEVKLINCPLTGSHLYKDHVTYIGNNQKLCFGIKKSETENYRNVFTASYITSEARCKIIEALIKYGKDILYWDTDSLFSKKPLDLDVGAEMGQWSFKGRYQSFKMLKTKTYMYVDYEGKKVVKCAGLRSKDYINFNDLKRGQILPNINLKAKRLQSGIVLLKHDYMM